MGAAEEMKRAYVEANPDEDPDRLVQMNVRLPRWLVWTLDQRRASINLSRDKWSLRALVFALAQPGDPRRRGSTVARTSRGRTVQPGGQKR